MRAALVRLSARLLSLAGDTFARRSCDDYVLPKDLSDEDFVDLGTLLANNAADVARAARELRTGASTSELMHGLSLALRRLADERERGERCSACGRPTMVGEDFGGPCPEDSDIACALAQRDEERARLTRERGLSSRWALAPFDALQAIAEHVHGIAREKGWHDGPVDVGAYVANLHGEASELWEAYRAGKLSEPCDKAARMTEPLTCAEEELADIVIRAMDSAARLGIDIGRAVRVKSAFNATRPHRHGGKLA